MARVALYAEPGNLASQRVAGKCGFVRVPGAVKREAEHLTTALPVFFEPGPAVVYAVSSRVRGDPRGFGALTQQSLQPQYWYLSDGWWSYRSITPPQHNDRLSRTDHRAPQHRA